MTKSIRNYGTPQELAATNSRNFRTFLLMAQFEAKEIGARIAQARELAGMTQEELAAVASFSKRSLQDYEAGVTIPYKHLREISRLIDKTVEWLLHGEPVSAEAQPRLEDLVAQLIGLLEEDLAQRREQPGAPSEQRG